MVIPVGAGDVILTEYQLHTAVMVYLREIHGVEIARVDKVRVPVYSAAGDVGCIVTLKAKS